MVDPALPVVQRGSLLYSVKIPRPALAKFGKARPISEVCQQIVRSFFNKTKFTLVQNVVCQKHISPHEGSKHLDFTFR